MTKAQPKVKEEVELTLEERIDLTNQEVARICMKYKTSLTVNQGISIVPVQEDEEGK
jgi:hypothetical protein